MAKRRWEDKGQPKVVKSRPTAVVRINSADYDKLQATSKLVGIPIRVLITRAVKLLQADPQFSRLLEASKAAYVAETEFRETLKK